MALWINSEGPTKEWAGDDHMNLAAACVKDDPDWHNARAKQLEDFAKARMTDHDNKMKEYEDAKRAFKDTTNAEPIYEEIKKLAQRDAQVAENANAVAKAYRDTAQALQNHSNATENDYYRLHKSIQDAIDLIVDPDPFERTKKQDAKAKALARTYREEFVKHKASLDSTIDGIHAGLANVFPPEWPPVDSRGLSGDDLNKFRQIHDFLEPRFASPSPFSIPKDQGGGFDPSGGSDSVKNPAFEPESDDDKAAREDAYPASHAAAGQPSEAIARVEGFSSAHIASPISSAGSTSSAGVPMMVPTPVSPLAGGGLSVPAHGFGIKGSPTSRARKKARQYRFPPRVTSDGITSAMASIPNNDYITMAHTLVAAIHAQAYETPGGNLPLDVAVGIFLTPEPKPVLFTGIGHSFLPYPFKSVMAASAFTVCQDENYHATALGLPLVFQAAKLLEYQPDYTLAGLVTTEEITNDQKNVLHSLRVDSSVVDHQDLNRMAGFLISSHLEPEVEPLELSSHDDFVATVLSLPASQAAAMQLARQLVDYSPNSEVLFKQLGELRGQFGSTCYGETARIAHDLYNDARIELFNHQLAPYQVIAKDELSYSLAANIKAHFETQSRLVIYANALLAATNGHIPSVINSAIHLGVPREDLEQWVTNSRAITIHETTNTENTTNTANTKAS